MWTISSIFNAESDLSSDVDDSSSSDSSSDDDELFYGKWNPLTYFFCNNHQSDTGRDRQHLQWTIKPRPTLCETTSQSIDGFKVLKQFLNVQKVVN